MTAADRPSVTDDARAEGNRRYPNSAGLARIFAEGAEWAAGRAETTTACTCDAAPAEIGGASHRPGCGEAETTTTTTEDARAEAERRAWERYPNANTAGMQAYVLHLRAGYAEGWAAGRAETTTTTAEDAIEDLAVELFERSHEPSFSDDERGMSEARAWACKIASDLLATARTRPTREQIARALRAEGFYGTHADRWGDRAWQDDYWNGLADAVLALWLAPTDITKEN